MTRAHRSFWVLTTTTVLSAGLVAQTLAARASPPADILLAAGTLLLAASSTLLIRVMSRLIPHNTPATGSTAANALARTDQPRRLTRATTPTDHALAAAPRVLAQQATVTATDAPNGTASRNPEASEAGAGAACHS